MRSPSPIVYAEWSLVFLSFRIMLCFVEKDCFKLNNNNHLINKHGTYEALKELTYRSFNENTASSIILNLTVAAAKCFFVNH